MRNWFGNYLYFSKATLCVRGLVFSHGFVSRAVSSILITYLTLHILKNYQTAAVLINLLSGGASILVIFLAYLSHKIGQFRMIAFTSFAYTLALALLWVSARFIRSGADAVDNFFYWAAVLIAIGEAGRAAVISKFLDDQYISEQRQRDHQYTNEEEKRFQSRQDALWSHPWFFGAVATLFIPGEAEWETVFLISMIAMGVCYLLFYYGKFYYSVSSSVETGPRGKFGVTPKENGHPYTKMLALSSAFVVYSLVEATGSTFFFEQTIYLNDKVGNFTIPVVYLTVLQSFSKVIISYLWGLLLPKQRRNVTLVKIGCGLVLSVLCCAFAWQIEIRRKTKIMMEVDVDDYDNEGISMSILWLLPQFSLLGLMRGLAEDGLVEFFSEQVVDDDKEVMLRYYGPYAFDFVLGIGTLLTAVSILGFRRTWLDQNIYRNRLDKYYKGLVFLGVANLGYYLCVAHYFYEKHKSENSAEEINDR